jgi:hypothetical protein
MSEYFKSCHQLERCLISKGINHNSFIIKSFGSSGCFVFYQTRNGIREMKISAVGVSYLNTNDAERIKDDLIRNGLIQ